MFDIKDKNVLITGATSGIGRAAAIELSSIGANIFFVARSESKAQLLIDDINRDEEKILADELSKYLNKSYTILENDGGTGYIK